MLISVIFTISFLLCIWNYYYPLSKFLDLSVKEKIIKDMQMTLEEQEQTQVEQDQVLEAKFEETERLATGKTRLLTYFKAYFFIFFLLLVCFPF